MSRIVSTSTHGSSCFFTFSFAQIGITVHSFKIILFVISFVDKLSYLCVKLKFPSSISRICYPFGCFYPFFFRLLIHRFGYNDASDPDIPAVSSREMPKAECDLQ